MDLAKRFKDKEELVKYLYDLKKKNKFMTVEMLTLVYRIGQAEGLTNTEIAHYGLSSYVSKKYKGQILSSKLKVVLNELERFGRVLRRTDTGGNHHFRVGLVSLEKDDWKRRKIDINGWS